MDSRSGWLYRQPVVEPRRSAWVSPPGLTALLWWAGQREMVVGAVAAELVVCVNFTTLLTYAYDKRQAEKAGWRVPEATLFLLALLGGSPAPSWPCAGSGTSRSRDRFA